MRQLITHNPGASKLILFMNGWAMTQAAVQHLQLAPDTDLLICSDYRTIETLHIIKSYQQIDIVAWSMGVWAAERVAADLMLLPLRNAVAVAGTPCPMHDHYGIPEAIFQGTHDQLNEDNRQRFNRRMCGGRSLQGLMSELADRPTDELKDELQAVMNDAYLFTEQHNITWTHAIIPSRDRVIPPQNQMNYWQQQADTQTITLEGCNHYCFNEWNQWLQIIER